MHFLATVAVLVYTAHAAVHGATPAAAVGTPTADQTARAGADQTARAGANETARVVAEAGRARGSEVIGDGAAEAARAHAQGWVDLGALGFFTRGAALVGEGRRALARVELPEAEQKLAAAESVYSLELARPGVAGEAATAALWRGVALFELARRAEADRAFRRAVALEPATTLTEALVRPDVARAFAAATAATATGGPVTKRARLIVRVPAGAELRVDDRPVALVDGKAQLEVGQGEHLAIARAPEMLPVAKLVDVPASGSELELTPAPDPIAQALASLQEQPTREGLDALFESLPADSALIVASGRDLGVSTLVAQRVRRDCATATVTAVRADELWRRADEAACEKNRPLDLLQSQPIEHPRPAPSLTLTRPIEGGPSRPPLWRRPWLWVAVVGVLGVGVVIVANVVPRAASYSGTLGFHDFALTR